MLTHDDDDHDEDAYLTDLVKIINDLVFATVCPKGQYNDGEVPTNTNMEEKRSNTHTPTKRSLKANADKQKLSNSHYWVLTLGRKLVGRTLSFDIMVSFKVSRSA